MVRTKWVLVAGIALLGCVNALVEGEKVLNVRRVRRRRRPASPSKMEDGSVIAAIVVGNSNNTKYNKVPSSSPVSSRERPAKPNAQKRKARLFR